MKQLALAAASRIDLSPQLVTLRIDESHRTIHTRLSISCPAVVPAVVRPDAAGEGE
jgi:hypothetical protein